MRVLVLGCVLTVCLSGAALAAWEEDLAAQLRWDEECTVAFISGAIERTIDGEQVIIAKAHCEDGRAFDVVRRHEFEDFEVTECSTEEQAC